MIEGAFNKGNESSSRDVSNERPRKLQTLLQSV